MGWEDHVTALFALVTSVLYGFADFGGGLLTRRLPALTVVVASQLVSAVVLGVIVVTTGAWSETGPRLWFAVAAGLVGPIAVIAFYQALALGPMGVVSPLGSLGVAVPLGVGVIVFGERPGLIAIAGIVIAVTGVVLAGGPQLRGPRPQRRAIVLALVAALGFGAIFALFAEASTTVTGLFLALFVQRLTNLAVGSVALWVSVRRDTLTLPSAGLLWPCLPVLGLVGLADAAANGTYSIAAQHGPVTVAAVLASLYPVVTALAAHGFLHERLRGLQILGASLALVGTVLLSAA